MRPRVRQGSLPGNEKRCWPLSSFGTSRKARQYRDDASATEATAPERSVPAIRPKTSTGSHGQTRSGYRLGNRQCGCQRLLIRLREQLSSAALLWRRWNGLSALGNLSALAGLPLRRWSGPSYIPASLLSECAGTGSTSGPGPLAR